MLGEYQLKSVLGVGGFGMTYLGWDSNLEKQVAIKEYLPGDLAVRALDGSVVPVSTDHQLDYQWGLDSFIREARILARFSHPHIVRVNRYFEANGTGYMVMDYEDGESLSQLLKRAPQPDETVLKRIVMPLLDGLAAVHEEKFLHRDIKPSNIFIRANGTPVLLDFGAARDTRGATRALTAVLTPGYAPLEQYAADGKQGPWSDIYAMGGVLFRAVTGKSPPDAVSRLQSDTVAQDLAAARRNYSKPLLNAIEWAMMVKLELRPQSITAWKAAIEGQSPLNFPFTTSVTATIPVAPVVDDVQPVKEIKSKRLPRDHASDWRRVGWVALFLALLMFGVGWYKRQQEPLPVTVGSPVPQASTVVPPPVSAAADSRSSRSDVGPAVPDRLRERVNDEFRRADRNGDGYLSPAEVEGRFPAIARDLSRADRDADGKISPEEFAELRRMQFEQRRLPLQKP